MNEHIQKLAEQQGLTGPNYFLSSQELEKFAELIVRECFLISRSSADGFSAAKRMKQHFGVE